MILEHMHMKFEINRTKIKGGCQLGTKVVTHDSKSDLPLCMNNVTYKSCCAGGIKNRFQMMRLRLL